MGVRDYAWSRDSWTLSFVCLKVEHSEHNTSNRCGGEYVAVAVASVILGAQIANGREESY